LTRLKTRCRLLATTLPAIALIFSLTGAAEAQFGKNKVRYKDFQWEIYHSTHFDVYYYEEEKHLLEKVVSYAESAYDELSQKLNYQIEQPTPLIFYQTHADFEQNNIILNFIPEGVGAFASPVRNRMVLPVDLPGPELLELIRHELTHIFQYQMLFNGNLSKGVASSPPLWFMEGMASYMAEDESARDRMYLRDAVVNDRLPPVTANFGGFFAYRYGHALFDFIEERYGEEGVRDFMIETRNTLGGRVGPALERSFGEDPEDFNNEFRRWLRKKYLPELIETGEPADFGRPFRKAPGPRSMQASPAASPSGDLLVAFSTAFEMFGTGGSPRVDVLLYNANERKVIRNLTKNFDKEFQYFVAQELTLGRKHGRDIAFSPDGNEVAFFARRNEGRVLVLVDVLKGGIHEVLDMDVQQQSAPAWSADGSSIAFGGHRNGQFDIFTVDLNTGSITQITDDEVFDAAPTYSPDGRSIVATSVVGGFSKLFRIDLDKPGERFPLTHGETHDTDAVYSSSGDKIFYTSDRSGANNIYSLDVPTGAILQHTNSVTGCFQPTTLAGAGGERLVFTCYWKGRFDLYLQEIDDPITEPVLIADSGDSETDVVRTEDLPAFEPAIEVAIDDRNRDKYKGGKFFIENIGGGVGVSNDRTAIAQVVLSFTNFLGDKRIIGAFQSVESFQNFDVFYTNLSKRWQWQAHLFDDRDFFRGRDARTGFVVRGDTAFSQTGAIASIIYPWNVSHRAEFGAGYISREIGFQNFIEVPAEELSLLEFSSLFADELEFLTSGLSPAQSAALTLNLYNEFISAGGPVPIPVVTPRKDDYPVIQAALVGDTAVATQWGLVSGRRWRVGASYAPDTSESGTLTQSLTLDFRQYVPLTRRSNLAFRGVGYLSEGNFPNPTYFGGYGDVRGVDFRSLVGNKAFYTNFEVRFPLIDQLSTPVLRFGGIQGVVFLDIAGAWYDEVEDFDFYNSAEDRLEDAIASYGWGVSFRLFGLPWNIDFANRTNFAHSGNSFSSELWIGPRF